MPMADTREGIDSPFPCCKRSSTSTWDASLQMGVGSRMHQTIDEVDVRPLREPGSKRRVSLGGGNKPKWRGDGKELFYLAADGTIMAVSVLGGSIGIDSKPLFKVRIGPTRNFGYDVNYAVTRDGRLCYPGAR